MKKKKSKLQSKMWGSSMKSGERERDNDRSEGVQERMTKQVIKQRIGLNSFRSRVECHDTSSTVIIQCCTHSSVHKDRVLRFALSLTDLAVAEMYWTTISRLVLKSFPRRGALRSSFRFMSSYIHRE